VRIQGFVDGFTQIGSAALNLGSGLADAHAAGDRAQAGEMQTNLDKNAANMTPEDVRSQAAEIKGIQQDAANCGARSAGEKSGAEALGGLDKIADGLFQGAITDKDTDAKVHDMAAQAAKRMVDDARSDEGDAKQLMEKALEFYKEYSETRAQTMMAATHRA
ncbi:MAG TPA: hypothetical protein VLM85_25180, partial [Polyangiaceae bacterium]|nr:hypothetical protein [Polyangiaceae bacterium]